MQDTLALHTTKLAEGYQKLKSKYESCKFHIHKKQVEVKALYADIKQQKKTIKTYELLLKKYDFDKRTKSSEGQSVDQESTRKEGGKEDGKFSFTVSKEKNTVQTKMKTYVGVQECDYETVNSKLFVTITSVLLIKYC